MEEKLSPGAQEHKRASSNCSVDLPTISVKQEPIDSDEEEKKGGSNMAELQQQLHEMEARATEAEAELRTANFSVMEWVDKASRFDNQRLAAEAALARERKKAKDAGDPSAQRAEYTKLIEKYQQTARHSIENAQRASDAQNSATRLVEELATSKQELQTARDAHLRAEELLRQEKARKDSIHEHTALEWKHKELERVHTLLKAEVEEAKRNVDIVNREKELLEIDLKIARAAPGSTTIVSESEKDAKIAQLEKDNENLRSLMEQISKQEKPSNSKTNEGGKNSASTAQAASVNNHADTQRIVVKNVENQRFIARLQAENADLNDRVEKLAKRLERYTQPPPHGSRPDVSRNDGGFHPNHHQQPQHQFNNRFNRPANLAEDDAKTIDDLQNTVIQFKKTLAEASNTREMLETDREELRASLRDKSQTITQLQTDVDSYRSRLMQLESLNFDLNAQIAKNSKDAEEGAKVIHKVAELNALIDEMEREKTKEAAKAAKEKLEMEEEIEELREKNVALASVSSKELREKLRAAEREIEELKSELSKPGPSKDSSEDAAKTGEKGKKIIVEQIPPPPFTLRAFAPKPPPPPEKKEKGWKRGFQPLGAPSPKKQNTGADTPIDHSIFERPHITAEVRDKIKFKLHPF